MGWTQERLAEETRVHTRTIQRIENDGLASPRTLNALAGALSVEPAILQPAKTVKQDADRRSISLKFRRRHNESIDRANRDTLFSEETQGWAVVGLGFFLIGGYLMVNLLLIIEGNLDNPDVVHFSFELYVVGGLLMMLLGCVFLDIANRFKSRVSARKMRGLKVAERTQYRALVRWLAWAIFLMGGGLVVSVLLITEQNLSRTTILGILLPGTVVGLLLMLLGGFGLKLSAGTAGDSDTQHTDPPSY